MSTPLLCRYAFGRFHLDPLRGRLTNGGTAIELRPKSLAVLHYLVAHPQRLVSKDEMLAAVWDRVIVTDDSLVQCVRDIRHALGDTEQQMIRTIPRARYMFVADVTEEAPEVAPEVLCGSTPPPAELEPRPSRWQLMRQLRGRWLPAGALVLLAAVAVVAMIAGQAGGERPVNIGSDAPVAPPPLSIVVLPLFNIDGDPEHEYFARGLTSDLTTDLGRVPFSLVISHNSAQTYRGGQVDSRQVGRELGVRYALEGSVQRVREVVHVNLRLVETANGALRWAEHFESQRAELPRLQVDIVRRIAQTLDLRMLEAEAERSVRERTLDPDAQDLLMQGWALWERRRAADNAKARALFTQALSADPKSSLAWIGVANTHLSDLHAGWSDDRPASLEHARQATLRAFEIGPRHRNVNAGRGYVLFFEGSVEPALAAFDQEIEVDAGNALAHVWRGLMLISLGRAAEALPSIERGILLSPRDVDLNVFHRSMAHACFSLGRFDEAVAWSRKAVGHTPTYAKGYAFLAAAAALAGDREMAASAIDNFRRLQPKFASIAAFKQSLMPGEMLMFGATPGFWQGLEKAGLPTG